MLKYPNDYSIFCKFNIEKGIIIYKLRKNELK